LKVKRCGFTSEDSSWSLFAEGKGRNEKPIDERSYQGKAKKKWGIALEVGSDEEMNLTNERREKKT